jgi:hypothetical protein
MNPQSLLLSSFFDRLNALGVTYCVMNNYEEMPLVIPTDVDISIEPRVFGSLDEIVFGFAREHGGEVAQKLWHGHEKCSYVLSVGGPGERAFLHLDLFTNSSVNGFPLLVTHEDLVNGRRPSRNFFTPRPEIEAVFIALRRIFKGDWNSSHCARIAALRSQIGSADWLSARYLWMEDIIALACKGDVEALTARQVSDRRTLKRLAWRWVGFSGALSYVYWQGRRLAYRLRHETGNVTVVVSRDPIPSDMLTALSTSLKDIFFRRSIVDLDRRSERFRAGMLANLLLAVRLRTMKAAKTGILLTVRQRGAEVPPVLKILDGVCVLDQIAVFDGSKLRTTSLATPVFQVDSPDTIFEIMLVSQIRKTDRARQKRWSQTGRAWASQHRLSK